MVTTRQYDSQNRLTSITNTPSAGGAATIGFSFRYNAANQRTAVTNADSAYWIYTYDALGQVTSGKKYWSDATPVAGQQFEYTFDTIGNRTTAGWGGNSSGAGLHYQNYSANNLNQYTSHGNAPYFQITGNANSNANLLATSDWGGVATLYRQGNYFMAEFYFDTSWLALPVWTTINVEAAIPGAGQNGADVASIAPTNHVYIPPTSESLSYDADGNLTQDGRWQYTWDAENRLVTVKAWPQLYGWPLLPSMSRLDFVYDAQGRRTQKVISTGYEAANYGYSHWEAGWTPVQTNRFIYDGWNLVAELTGASPSTSTLLWSYMWGSDLSGSMQGAGGVGGLLAMSYHGPQTTNCFVAYDGNGNVIALIDAANGASAAQYEYGPFGEGLRATGPAAKANPFRFSTKWQDDETDLSYYPPGRYFSSLLGRWSSRDPIGEPGGRNLYAFVENSPIDNIDLGGLITIDRTMGTLITCGGIDLHYLIDIGMRPLTKGFLVQHLIISEKAVTCDGTRNVSGVRELWEALGPPAAETGRGIRPFERNDEMQYMVDRNCFPNPLAHIYGPRRSYWQGVGFTALYREVRYFDYRITHDLRTLWTETIPSYETAPITSHRPDWWDRSYAIWTPPAWNTWLLYWNCCCRPWQQLFSDTAPGADVDYGGPP